MISYNNFNDDDFVGNDLESTNYDDSEFVFSRNNNPSMAVPSFKNGSHSNSCTSCGHSLMDTQWVEDVILKQEECKKCGHSIKENGYRECVMQSDKIEKVEHMDNTVSSPSVILISFIPYLIMLLFCFLLAARRKELSLSSGFCIFFFPYVYISYVLIDCFVIPAHTN